MSVTRDASTGFLRRFRGEERDRAAVRRIARMAVGELRADVSRRNRREPQVERHHVVLVVEALFLLGIESECDLAAVGEMS
jgi:hypothetical protein